MSPNLAPIFQRVQQKRLIISYICEKKINQQMKYLNEPKINDAFCTNIEVIFLKTGEISIPEDSYR